MNKEQRMLQARQRIMSRIKDRDAMEADSLSTFKGLTPEQIKVNYEAATLEREIEQFNLAFNITTEEEFLDVAAFLHGLVRHLDESNESLAKRLDALYNKHN